MEDWPPHLPDLNPHNFIMSKYANTYLNAENSSSSKFKEIKMILECGNYDKQL